MKKKMIRVQLTPDPEINKKALPPDMVAEINWFKQQFDGSIQLTGYWVEEGSDHARRAVEAQRCFKNKTNDN